MSAELEAGGRVGGTSLVVVVCCCCAGSGSSFMVPKGSNSKGSRDGSSGRTFEKRDRPGVGGARDDGSSIMGRVSPFEFRGFPRYIGNWKYYLLAPSCLLKRGPAKKKKKKNTREGGRGIRVCRESRVSR